MISAIILIIIIILRTYNLTKISHSVTNSSQSLQSESQSWLAVAQISSSTSA